MGLIPMQRNDLTMGEIDLSYINISLSGELLRNLSMERLIEEGVVNGETKISMNGAAMVDTGEYTGIGSFPIEAGQYSVVDMLDQPIDFVVNGIAKGFEFLPPYIESIESLKSFF